MALDKRQALIAQLSSISDALDNIVTREDIEVLDVALEVISKYENAIPKLKRAGIDTSRGEARLKEAKDKANKIKREFG